MKNYCQNCGHDCHCGEDCIKEYDKGTKILCCGVCRHDEDKKNTTNPVFVSVQVIMDSTYQNNCSFFFASSK